MEDINIIKPLRPQGSNWQLVPVKRGQLDLFDRLGKRAECWLLMSKCLTWSVQVFSTVEVVTQEKGVETEPHYHISMCFKNGHGGISRIDSSLATDVLKAFNADGFLEDNHVPGGQVRNFWRPVADPLVGMECKCKDTEPAIVEDKGDYVWRGADHV